MYAPQGDQNFAELLRSTQQLAKNIRQQHEQQQGPISPNMFANQQMPPPPPFQQPGPFQQPFQQPPSYMQQQHQPLPSHALPHFPFGHAMTPPGSISIDSNGLRMGSIDSDMAYDGIEELLIDSMLDDSKLAVAAAANAQPMPMNHKRDRGGTFMFS